MQVKKKKNKSTIDCILNMNFSIFHGLGKNKLDNLIFAFASVLQGASSIVTFPWFTQSLASLLRILEEKAVSVV